MSYTFVFSSRARDDIEALDPSIKKRLKKKLEFFARHGDITTFAKKLTNQKVGQFRIRIGDYRMIFDRQGKILSVLRVQHRSIIYK